MGQDGNFQNVNLPVVIPKINVTVEDFVIAFAAGMMGNALSSLLGYVSTFLSVLCYTISVVLCVSLLAFSRKKRAAEIQTRGVSRVGVLRRYLSYWVGADRLRGR